MPELIESYYETQGITEGEDLQQDQDIADRASGLYNTFYYVGMIVSPITGSLIYENYRNFNKTCDIFAIFSDCFTIIYIVFNVITDSKSLWNKN